jgi:hypothetical protein
MAKNAGLIFPTLTCHIQRKGSGQIRPDFKGEKPSKRIKIPEKKVQSTNFN